MTAGQKRVDLVAKLSGKAQWQQPADHPVGSDDRNRCLHLRLGSKLSGNQHWSPRDETRDGESLGATSWP